MSVLHGDFRGAYFCLVVALSTKGFCSPPHSRKKSVSKVPGASLYKGAVEVPTVTVLVEPGSKQVKERWRKTEPHPKIQNGILRGQLIELRAKAAPG